MSATLVELPFNFPGKVYRSPMPFGYFDPEQAVLGEYQKAGINLVVMLVSDEEARQRTGRDLREVYRANGMEVVYLPIPDFYIPDPTALLSGLERVQTEAQAGRNVVVHCNAGVGRTGVFMACLARQVFGMPGRQAISWVQQYVEHAVESEVQYAFVQNLELRPGA